MNINSNPHNCIECRACVQICSKSAITMVQNSEGFSYPSVDADKCIDCGLCNKVCPILNSETLKYEKGKVYASQLKDQKILMKSSSGGVFSAIAECVLEKNGVVFGAAWDENLQLHHIGVDSKTELEKLRGSKYVHSDIQNTYIEAREHLKAGRWVYYTGTPCQIAGLRLFLRKDYPTLITSDLVCHGTPSQMMFNKFIRQMEAERGEKLIEYSFRDKRVFGWSCSSSSSSIDAKGRKHYWYYDRNMRAYFNAFIKGHITRNDCYECPFACPQRVSDITMADYWDIKDHHPEFKNQRDGVSMMIVNSDKGKELFSELTGRFELIESSLEDALNTSNHNLKAPTPKPQERAEAYIKASQNFIAFRDSYLLGDKPESYFQQYYRIQMIKRLPIIKQFLKLIGKA